MNEPVDTSDEACAVACMLVSNPQGAFRTDGDGWQKRVNDLIRALRDERNDAANLVRRAGYEAPRPEYTELVGSYEHQMPPAVPVRAHCPVCGGPDTDDCERDDCGLMQAQYRMPRQS